MRSSASVHVHHPCKAAWLLLLSPAPHLDVVPIAGRRLLHHNLRGGGGGGGSGGCCSGRYRHGAKSQCWATSTGKFYSRQRAGDLQLPSHVLVLPHPFPSPRCPCPRLFRTVYGTLTTSPPSPLPRFCTLPSLIPRMLPRNSTFFFNTHTYTQTHTHIALLHRLHSLCAYFALCSLTHTCVSSST